ncbi:hypothetical protein Rsub_11088 [Raphidocelis subcapitata]|uniref:Peptidase M20 dimerisation domain-containing protein n=1 Tax=Raphidocelis subcapitata TaxID=307507 RepID=A0A2V0PKC0_9CHLO|nr:hypothetical protein Rsub_11088 [Raphidocelis subcapitata]|eukprot:GBF98443.1 hypothetical protein Rsub_11088 [Raphidocelis subcapitata]
MTHRSRASRFGTLLLIALAHRAAAAAGATADAAAEAGAAAARAARYRGSALPAFRKDLLALAAIPSVSSLPQHADDVLAAADWLVSKLRAAGLGNVSLLPTEGAQPVVFAEHMGAGPDAPTVLIYGHYDVQPVDPLDLWTSPPFAPEERGGYFYGRGVDDDKGGLLNAVHAVESYLQAASEGGAPGRLPVNVKFLLEGQEEIGSPNLAPFLTRHAALFADADVALSADGGQISEAQPGIPTGFRGAIGLQVDIVTAGIDMHSGMKGGSVQNAAHALIQLLATLRDPSTGRVAVSGFYESVVEPDADDRDDMEVGGWYRPTLEVVGMGSGFSGQGIKTIVPASSFAKLSARLVPNQAPEEVAGKVEAHLRAHAPPLANLTVTVMGFRADPWRSPRRTPGNVAAARALRKVMGAEPLFFKDGGTVPALAYLDSLLGLPTTVFAFCLGERIHAPNERLKVSMFDLGSLGWIELLSELGATGKAAFAEAKAARARGAAAAAAEEEEEQGGARDEL